MSQIEILKGTDVDITLNVTGIDLVDITGITISLEKSGDVPITFTMQGGQVTVGLTSANLRIEDNIITSAGVYMIRMTATENGNIRGLKTVPSFITVI